MRNETTKMIPDKREQRETKILNTLKIKETGYEAERRNSERGRVMKRKG